jgi:hypothetical protein
MSLDAARRVADAVLFEGYVLYPYRASALKNQARWQFGVLAPAGTLGEPSYARTECLLEPAGEDVELTVVARFLQLRRGPGPIPWDEGVVREVTTTARLAADAHDATFEVPGDAAMRPLRVAVRVTAERVAGPCELLRVRVNLENRTPAPDPAAPRPEMLPHALVSTHALLGVRGGVFLSQIDPPLWAADAARACRNEHTWPVLVGEERDVMLSAPIILYDQPEIAPESPGHFYDSTEIDELLTLRTLTLTDEEKRAARATDPRSAELLDRVEAMPPEVLERLHGAVRYLRRTVRPERVEVPGGSVGPGSRVRIRPTGRADAQDMFLRDRTATVEAVLFDVDGATHLALTLDDDPAADLKREVGRYLYFAPDDVEVLP